MNLMDPFHFRIFEDSVIDYVYCECQSSKVLKFDTSLIYWYYKYLYQNGYQYYQGTTTFSLWKSVHLADLLCRGRIVSKCAFVV